MFNCFQQINIHGVSAQVAWAKKKNSDQVVAAGDPFKEWLDPNKYFLNILMVIFMLFLTSASFHGMFSDELHSLVNQPWSFQLGPSMSY